MKDVILLLGALGLIAFLAMLALGIVGSAIKFWVDLVV